MEGGTWRCSVCKAIKELSGSHLTGKNSVCSDCPTCAKKRTFCLEFPSRGTAPVVAAPSLFNLNHSSGPATVSLPSTPRNLFARATHTPIDTPSQTRVAFLGCLAALTPLSNQTQKPAVDQRMMSSLPCPGDPPSRTAIKAPSANTSPIVMHSASFNDGQRQSPPFEFVAAPNAVVLPTTLPSALVATTPLWRCSVCYKVKELSGKHLTGKTSVRSDCQTCAKKREFFLSVPADDMSPLPCSTSGDPFIAPKFVTPPSTDSQLWREPVIPLEARMSDLLLDPLVLSGPALAASFEGEVLREYRHQLVEGVRPRTAWRQRTIYVLAPTRRSHSTGIEKTENPQKIKKPSDAEMGVFCRKDVEMLGEVAAILLAVEHKLAASPFRVMRRLFCPDEFTFAAACMYANTFLSGDCDTSAKQSAFVVFGPRVDHTVPTTRWGTIIESCAAARQIVVSGEQRVEGAQSIFQSAGWLTLPLHAAAEAIRLVENSLLAQREKNSRKESEMEKEEEQTLGVDLVLVRETMRLEDLPQAAALAMPVKPF